MTSLRFYFDGNQTTVFKDLDADTIQKIMNTLNDSRVDSFMLGQQWINKNAIITVLPELEQVAQEVPTETGTVEPLPESNSAA